jgi:hypothetical protein
MIKMKNLLAENMVRFGTKNLSESKLQRLHEQTANVQELVKELFNLLLTHVKQMVVGQFSDRVMNNDVLLTEMAKTQNAIRNMLYKYEKKELVDSIEKFNMFKQDVENLIKTNERILNYPGAVPQVEVDKILTQIETALNV